MPRKKSFTVEWALDKALEAFAERGYHRTSMQAIVKHLKLSRSSVYAIFHTKRCSGGRCGGHRRGCARAGRN